MTSRVVRSWPTTLRTLAGRREPIALGVRLRIPLEIDEAVLKAIDERLHRYPSSAAV